MIQAVLGPLRSGTHSIQDTLNELSVPRKLYLAELSVSGVLIQYIECDNRMYTQLFSSAE